MKSEIPPPIKIAVFASGRGSNFRALNESLRADTRAVAEIVACISNNPKPGAFDYAASQGIKSIRFSPKMFESETAYVEELRHFLKERGIELIVLAGYMRRIPSQIVDVYAGRILNIHPSLLPNFGGEGMYGENVHKAVIAAGATVSGATVHFVDGEYDTGKIIDQQTVPVLFTDTPETLAARILEAEHELLPRVVKAFAMQLQDERQRKMG